MSKVLHRFLVVIEHTRRAEANRWECIGPFLREGSAVNFARSRNGINGQIVNVFPMIDPRVFHRKPGST